MEAAIENPSLWSRLPLTAKALIIIAVWLVGSEVNDHYAERRDLRDLAVQERQMTLKERQAEIDIRAAQSRPVRTVEKLARLASDDCSNGNAWEESNPGVREVQGSFSVGPGCLRISPQFEVREIRGDRYIISFGSVPGKTGFYYENCHSSQECIAMIAANPQGPFRVTVQNGGIVTILKGDRDV